ncbi:hypothetical protein RJ639_023724 [Escallonia herrerae]|uniref:Uncharacterized protein n=1 Tax=Escallonia herrerae TaxID=1293975 RepID=A0AA88V301_9ASTE|nr:hypothetical protein RJ639_023724 [Escallonia herrerae]
MECAGRPNRSDVHLSREEEAKIEGETRDHFDNLAPKRHSKPQRSDYSSKYVDGQGTDNGVIPEYLEFQHLQNDSQVSSFAPYDPKLEYNGGKVTEEFVETEYYKDLNGVDKQHHTTGTGFIKMEDTNGSPFSIDSESACACHASCKGNPATNDWIPAAADNVTLICARSFLSVTMLFELFLVQRCLDRSSSSSIRTNNFSSFRQLWYLASRKGVTIDVDSRSVQSCPQ